MSSPPESPGCSAPLLADMVRVEALYFLGSVERKRGEAQEAERIARSLETIAAPTAYTRSRCHQLRADMASDSGSPMEAVRELEMARTCEDSEKVSRSLVPVRFSLAQAYWRVRLGGNSGARRPHPFREACISGRCFMSQLPFPRTVARDDRDLSAAEAFFGGFGALGRRRPRSEWSPRHVVSS
jgi:hypothetical protein